MRWIPLFAVCLVACKYEAAASLEDPFDPSSEAVVPEWVMGEIEGAEDACSSSQYWESGSMATTYFAGAFVMDEGAGTVVGNSFWLLYPNERFEATGFRPCTVVWDFTGTLEPTDNPNVFEMYTSAVIDEPQSDCPQDANGTEIWAGEQATSESYRLMIAGDSVQISFLASGNPLGNGQIDRDVVTWMSERNCKIF